MKSKLVASIIVSMLLLGIFASAIAITPIIKADVVYHLDVYTAPPGIPINGTGNYPDQSYANLDALDEYIVGDTKYIFSYWDVDNGAVGGDPIFVYMDNNHNATAHYTKEFKFTVFYPWSASWLESFVPAIWKEGSGFVAGSGANGTYWAWMPEGSFAQAGIRRTDNGLWMGVPWIYGSNYDSTIVFVNWTSLGYYISGGWAWSSAGMINMTGPKTAAVDWKYWYYLTVTSDQPPAPGGAGWYAQNSIVTLTANTIVVNWAREWRLDHWEVDAVSRGAGVNPINVTMNTNHTASAFYKCWVFIYLDDDIGNMSGIKDLGKWYPEGVPLYFSAPDPVSIDSSHRYGFKYWYKVGSGWTNTSNPVCITLDATWAGYTLRAIYHMQYLMLLFSNPTGIPGYLYPDSDVSGWYWAGDTVNLKAKPIVQVSSTQRYSFIQWRNHLGGTNPANNITFAIMQPWNVTADYSLEWLLTWSHTPTSITVTGSPGQTWMTNGSDLWYSLPATDVSGNYVFKDWVINSVTYPQGQNTVHVGTVTGPVTGVANYANKTKIFMDPSYHKETSPAYCHEFDVTVYATNFDANRLVGGQPMDIYAFDIGIKWNSALLELKSVTTNLADFFAPNAFFLGMSQISAGYYHIVATVKGNFTGFSGTKAMFTMRFHVIKDECYPNTAWTWIEFDPLARFLSNHLGNPIGPELGWQDCYYDLQTKKPTLDFRDHKDGDHQVVVQWNVPQSFFDVDVYLLDGVKVHDFYVTVDYDETSIEVDTVVIGSYLKPPFSAYLWWKSAGILYVWVAEDTGVPLQNGTGLLFTITFKVVNAIYYKLAGPNYLTTDITCTATTYLSVYCPTPNYQYYSANLDAVKCTYLYNPLPGDLNFDGYVNVLDLQLIMDHWGMTPDYDIVTNGTTDLYDLVFVALRFGTSAH